MTAYKRPTQEISLFDDQIELANNVRAEWKSHLRMLVKAPTGFGKTRFAAYMINGLIANHLRVCFVVPRISLIGQTADAFSRLGIDNIGFIWGDEEQNHSALVTIASQDTLIRRDYQHFDLYIIDECDIKRVEMLRRMDEYPDQRYIGLTATPFAPWLGNYYTKMVKSKSMRWLIENGRLSPYDVYLPSKPNVSKVSLNYKDGEADYNQTELAEIMGDSKVVGDIVQNWLENGENRITMALCVNKAHGGFVTQGFLHTGVQAELITGDTPIAERENIFNRALDGITKIIVSIETLTQGFDMPECSCLINARPTKSKRRFSQGIGRVLRFLPSKRAIIFDHSGSFIEHGMVEDIDIDHLLSDKTGQEVKEVLLLTEDKPESKPKECKKCNYLKPAGVYQCPKCGHKPIGGEDVETDTERTLKKLGKKKLPTMEEKQEFYSGLLGWQKEQHNKGKTIKDGAIAHKYRNKFGVWPNQLKKIPLMPSAEVRNYLKYEAIKWAKGRK